MNQHPTKLLRCADELTLDSLADSVAYRIFRLGSSSVPVSHMFRLTQSAITAKTCPSHSTDVGPWVVAAFDASAANLWVRVASTIALINFWNLTQPTDRGAFDACHNVVEGFRGGEYRCLSFHRPPPVLADLLSELCNQCVAEG